MKNTWKFGAAAGMAAMVLAGCGDGAAPVEDQDVETPAEPPSEVAEAEFPVTLVDAMGDEVVIEEEPESFVSMIPSNTEIAYELGLGEKMVGVSDFDNYPEEVADLEKIGGQEFNVEKIISLQPDVVLAHESGLGMGTEGYQQLRDAGVNVFVVENAETFDEVYETISVIGQVSGAVEAADGLIEEMEAQVAEVEELAAGVDESKSVFVEIGSEPELYTAGTGTFIHEMLTMIQAENVAGDQEGWISMDPEAVVAANPEIIITTEGGYIENAAELIKERSGYPDVTAVQEDAIYELNPDTVTRPGPRLTEGLMTLAEVIYPETFSE
ncbi:ABC transporter substrate-binding protein [Planococcus sp. CP5-4]|uniref:ABC transporter substrate-binding protein n=1 Tax=unclassified Planococcus (in: firmicutes) TaxID=2662419 RepID=UPI001C216315|nr:MULTISPECIES: ABC transporter substrate-binding protein [unclassified Planococcus (in: firmicutes)]MBU9673504.1 ABC transporter substrate-binding protein [Planococcus sp. CP5-4_YE]MBV0908276.1 ABC transporter substrate-binding protein [Planococcus sp. CP5-4_UN]MBW6062338.1 ABC transporter substrate-binding protein [Planococcus sp. CP5-4]